MESTLEVTEKEQGSLEADDYPANMPSGIQYALAYYADAREDLIEAIKNSDPKWRHRMSVLLDWPALRF